MQKIFFLDIDDCLIQTTRLTKEHLRVIETTLYKLGVSKSREITGEFFRAFRRLYDKHQGKSLSAKEDILLANYMKRLTQLEQPVVDAFGEVKRWSREVNLFVAAEKYKVKLTYNQVHETTSKLWDKIAQKADYYPDTIPFLHKLFSRNISAFLISSSDSRLKYNNSSGLFFYDPDYSRCLKMKRLQKFRDLGIPENHIFIGDPYDKPKKWVFEEALKEARREAGPILGLKTVMVGDSLVNDLSPARLAGFDKFYWLRRELPTPCFVRPDGIIVINSLGEIDVS